MSQQNNFFGGFFLGALLGGALGGVIGAAAINRIKSQGGSGDTDFSQLTDELKRNLADATPEERMELARQSVEDKISQLNTALNAAIEEARQQLNNVNGHAESPNVYDAPSFRDP